MPNFLFKDNNMPPDFSLFSRNLPTWILGKLLSRSLDYIPYPSQVLLVQTNLQMTLSDFVLVNSQVHSD